MSLQRLIYALALLALLWLGRAIVQEPAPLPLTRSDGSLQVADYRIIPLEAFSLEARVLGREDYHFDRGAVISPTDLALAACRTFPLRSRIIPASAPPRPAHAPLSHDRSQDRLPTAAIGGRVAA